MSYARYSKAIAATATTATAARLDPLAVAELDIGAKVGELVGGIGGGRWRRRGGMRRWWR